MMCNRRNQNGLSMTELMVAIAIFAVVMASAMAAFKRFGGVANKLRKDVFTDQTFAGFSQKFVADVMNSDVGMHFLNLPIKVNGCAAKEACVKKGELDGSFSDISGIPGVATLQFYRDEQGALQNFPAYTPSDPIRIMRNQPITFSNAILSNNYYVTWPLSAKDNAAFVMMTRKVDSSVYFTFPDAFATSSPDSVAGNWSIVLASAPNVDPLTIQGSLFVIFNAIEPLQYFVRAVDKVEDCSNKKGGKSVCQKEADSLNAFHGLDLTAGRYFKMSFVDVPYQPGFFPTVGVWPSGQWWNQNASEYLFPTKVVSIRDNGGRPLADPRILSHYYHMLGQGNSRLIALPIQLQSYLLKEQPDKKRYVVRRDYYPSRSLVVLRDLPANTEITVARKLGTRDVSVFKSR